MKTRFNLAIVPIQTSNDEYVFDNGIRAKFPISSIENLLFDKLLDKLKKSHPSGLFSVWGIGAGEKSSNANNWNKLNSNDLLLFYKRSDYAVITRVAQKFQSENVGRQIWPNSSESDVNQYVITVDDILQSDLNFNKYFTKTFANKLSGLNSFEVLENLMLSDVFSESLLASESFHDFIARSEDIESGFVDTVPDGEVDDDSPISSTAKSLGLSAAERRIIENHAVTLAKEHFKMMGYSKIEDVGSYESFDLKVQRDHEILYVEVKGTTSNGDSIVLTRNEVDLHLKVFPNNALFLVTQIQLDKSADLRASGGVIQVISPWKIVNENLSVIAFNYRL